MKARRAQTMPIVFVIFAMVLSLGISGRARAEASTDSMGEADRIGGYVYDVGLLRPAGVLKLVFGSALLVPSYPLAIASDQRSQIVEILVTGPAKDTFTRPIGDFQ